MVWDNRNCVICKLNREVMFFAPIPRTPPFIIYKGSPRSSRLISGSLTISTSTWGQNSHIDYGIVGGRCFEASTALALKRKENIGYVDSAFIVEAVAEEASKLDVSRETKDVTRFLTIADVRYAINNPSFILSLT